MTESMLPPSHAGSVVLELGGSTGALVVHVPAELAGLEIDTSLVGDPRSHTHSAVRERHLANGVAHAAVFPAMEAGQHTIWSPQGGTAGTVQVVAGAVTELDWRCLRLKPAGGGGRSLSPEPAVGSTDPRIPTAAPDTKEKHPR